MPGTLKKHDLESVISISIEKISLKTNEQYLAGFSTYNLFKETPFIQTVDRYARKMPKILSDTYWNSTMYLCLRKLRKHDAVLGLIPTPVSSGDTSLTLGVVNEFSDAFIHDIPVYITEFELNTKHIKDFYEPKTLQDVFKQDKLLIPNEWYNKSIIVRRAFKHMNWS